MTIIDLTIAEYQVRTGRSYPPASLALYRKKASFRDSFAVDEHEAEYFFVGVTPNGKTWPTLVVEQRFHSHQHIFNPGVLLVPATKTLFVGAGTRLLAYSLHPDPHRLWECETEFGFIGWQVFESVVLMSAELEFAAWSNAGVKPWSTFVEPPWSFTVQAGEVELEVMGKYTTFNLSSGPHSVP
jgi:hypothetical protein